ncbi:xylulokinase [Aestuariicoccus sp. MJ-SS9]|uniref:xylulokinase n=1 Tax=Aestuariicoccus sp. MJ-SS9 TaxID=3079855 RepID=UPI002915B49E|nr:xylulokinase [Aestuariicoccus sp. MJ-SS9]MDU8912372.1 xylulokinase [Aestuariicoccus sp. MJ-SS9]
MQIGLDIGTSSVIAVLVRDGAILASESVPLNTSSPGPYRSEQDPESWWQACRAALRGVAAAAPEGAVTALGLSGQMHGLVALGAGHEVLHPAILWNDGRAHAESAALARALPEIGQIAGVPPLPGLTAPKVMWLRKHRPEVWGAIRHVLLPKDYIGLRLHGETVTDPADAAGTLWLDQAARRWSEAVCAASDTDPAWLPPILHGHEVAGRLRADVADDLGLPAGIPVVAGAGDAASGAVSVGAVEEGAAFLSMGTSGQLFVAGDAYRPNPAAMVHAFAHTLPDRWFQMAAMLNGARPMAWFANVAKADIRTLLEEAAGVQPDRVPLFLPYLTGERSPHADPHIRGAFYGLEDATTRAEMMRAVVEAVAFSFADAFASFGPRDYGTVLAIGGGAQSDLVLQTVADATGQRIGRADGALAGPAMGTAMLAAVGQGAMTRADLARRPAAQAVFEPNDTPVLQERLARYRTLYAALKPLASGRTAE